jgi:hypothetical protein
MCFSIKILLLVFILNSFVYSQNSLLKQKIEELKRVNNHLKINRRANVEIVKQELDLMDKIRSVSEKDMDDAQRVGAKAVRLFPCCMLEELTHSMEELSDTLTMFDVEDDLNDRRIGLRDPRRFSTYLLADIIKDSNDNSREFTAELEYQSGLIGIKKNRGNHGFLIDVGKVPLENINQQSREVISLAKYTPPECEIWEEYRNIKDEFASDGLSFRVEIPAMVGDTYILRAISYHESDANLDKIFAIKILRKDLDGSIIFFIKTIQQFEPPKLREPQREEFFRIEYLGLKTVIERNLKQNGFNDVQVETVATGKLITLKGIVPIGKTAEAIKIVENVYRDAIYLKVRLKNELTEK